ncbi:MAG TPA: hypothetical protein VF062_21165 [Candidatus Limnocylindrales bacterium]
MAQETRVNPPILDAGARVCEDLRGEIGQAVANAPPTGALMRDVVPATEHAAGGLPGWLTQRALQVLLQKQGDDMSRLSRRFTAIAEALQATADAYRRNENANAALFRRADGPW